MFSIKNVLLSVLLSAVIVSVNAISCYQCNSVNDADCTDIENGPPHKKALYFQECKSFVEYGEHKPFCRKTVVQTIFPHEERRISRACGWLQHKLPCYKTNNEDHLETSCQCFEDGCNGSSHVYGMSAALLVVIGFVCFNL